MLLLSGLEGGVIFESLNESHKFMIMDLCRICPGLHLGSVMMYCFISKALSTFDIKRPISAETGKEFDPPVDAAPGNVR